MTKKRKAGWWVSRGVCLAVIAVVLIVTLFPLYWIIMTSFKTYEESISFPPTLLPAQWSLTGYQEILSVPQMTRSFFNTVIYAVVGVFFSVLFATMAGYAFAKYRFRGNRILFLLTLSVVMIPTQVTFIPVFLTISDWGWVNTFLGLIIPKLPNAFGIFLVRQFARGIPDALFESARIDGAGEFRNFASIFVPLAFPAITTLTVMDFMAKWNDLFWPLIVTTTPEMQTLQYTLITATRSKYDIYWNELCAGMLLSMIPILLLYIFFQKYFTQGIASVGVKG